MIKLLKTVLATLANVPEKGGANQIMIVAIVSLMVILGIVYLLA